MNSFLILGHKGYLGASFCNMLISRGYEVSVLTDKVTLERIPTLAKKYFVSDNSKISNLANWKPYTTPKEGIEKVIKLS